MVLGSRVYQQSSWYVYLDTHMQSLLNQSIILLEDEFEFNPPRFEDYSFVVFPAAKAYEGFIKKILLDLELIDHDQFSSKYFRIGRSLNPDLPERFRDEDWLFERLQQTVVGCGDPNIAEKMWIAWTNGRNKLFHYFNGHGQTYDLDLHEAETRIDTFIEVIKHTVECELVKA